MKTDINRLWNKIEITNNCWLWYGAINSDGYGNLQYKRKPYKAHRLIYELLVEKIPTGLQIDHLCRNRRCVNPDHLEPVTQAENLKRGIYYQLLKTHCPRGHEYSKMNTYINPRGHRVCRTCRKKKY